MSQRKQNINGPEGAAYHSAENTKGRLATVRRKNGRSDRIRTCDFLLPKQALYQAELRSELSKYW